MSVEVEDIKSDVHHGHEKYDEGAEIYSWQSVVLAVIIVVLILVISATFIKWLAQTNFFERRSRNIDKGIKFY
uniref:Uncharacterized protein n=1 Tax=Acrobeloides nanus TaxID=290746 RepID=A0A914BV62_9BILA